MPRAPLTRKVVGFLPEHPNSHRQRCSSRVSLGVSGRVPSSSTGLCGSRASSCHGPRWLRDLPRLPPWPSFCPTGTPGPPGQPFPPGPPATVGRLPRHSASLALHVPRICIPTCTLPGSASRPSRRWHCTCRRSTLSCFLRGTRRSSSEPPLAVHPRQRKATLLVARRTRSWRERPRRGD